MDTISFALGIISQIELIRQWAKSLKQRYKGMRKMSELCENIDQRLINAKLALKRLAEFPSDNMSEMWRSYTSKLGRFCANAQGKLKELDKKAKSSSKVRLMRKEPKYTQALTELQDGLDNVEKYAVHLDGYASIIEEVRKLHVKVNDSYKAKYNVPRNNGRLILDVDNKDTPEGQLKHLVLQSKVGMIDAFGEKGTKAVALGMSGVGKTCAIKAVGNDREVQKCYWGGVYFFRFGPNITDKWVVNMVADAVKESGGHSTAKEMRNEKSLESAIKKASGWFGGKRCLFICDDMWSSEECHCGYVHVISELCTGRDGGYVLMSTRAQAVAEEVGEECSVTFPVRDDKKAGEMLCKYARVKEDVMETNERGVRESYKYVLKRCGGLPVALGVAGKTIRRIYTRMRRGGGEEAVCARDALVEYQRQLERRSKHGENLVKEGNGLDYAGLFAALKTSLKVVDKIDAKDTGKGGWPVSMLHRGLCVLQKQQWAPLTMLLCLWGVDEDTAETMCEAMEGISVCEIEHRVVDGSKVMGVRVHDLIHEYCLMEAMSRAEVEKWHTNVVKGYWKRYVEVGGGRNGMRKEDGNEEDGWWSDGLIQDSYIHSNLARHLVDSGRGHELELLLLDYRWTIKQLGLNRYLGLANDFHELLRCLEQRRGAKDGKSIAVSMHNSSPLRNGICSYAEEIVALVSKSEVGLILKALQTSWSRVTIGTEELDFRQIAFQLVGRLTGASEEMRGVKQCLSSVTKWTKKPCVLPEKGCMESAREFVEEVHVGSEVTSVVLLADPGKVIVGARSGEILLVHVRSAEILKRYAGHLKDVESVAVSCDDRWMVSGSRDETVRRWDVEGGKSIGNPLLGHEGGILSVAINEENDIIASGGEDRTVRLWRSTGELIGQPLCGHEEEVNSVAISSDGQRVVSCSHDKTIRVWSVEKGIEMTEPLRGHIDPVASVAISRNNRQIIVSGSHDKTVRLWDMSTGRQTGDALDGHEGLVNSVAVSDDCKVIASASDDKSVRIWKVSRENAVEVVLYGHTSIVQCVALSSDGSRVVSGSQDRTVRIWNISNAQELSTIEAEDMRKASALCVSIDKKVVVAGYDDGGISTWNTATGQTREIGSYGQKSGVGSIAVSSDKQYVVSGLWDSTVRIWDATTGKQVGDALHGHNDVVLSVTISHNSLWFVSASCDNTMRLWELPSGKTIESPLVGHDDYVNCVVISNDDHFVVSGSDDQTVRVWEKRSGKTILNPLKHDCSVESVYMSRDNQQIISMDSNNKVYLWSVSSGKLTKWATDGPGCANLLWKARNGWNGGVEAGVESDKEKLRVAVFDLDVYICDPMRKTGLFEKVGQLSTWVKDWGVDEKGILWVCFWGSKVARLEVVTESFNTLENRENEATV